MKIIKKILILLLKLIIILLLAIIFIILQVYIISLMELNTETMTYLIASLGLTLTLIELWDKFTAKPEDKTLEKNSEKIIDLLKEINENDKSKNALKVKVKKIHKK